MRVSLLTSPDPWPLSYQLIHLFLIQKLHHFTDILRVLASGDQQSVRRFYHDYISDPDRCYEFPRGMHVIAAGIQKKGAGSVDQVAFRWSGLGGVVFVQRSPGTQI